jgi:hypothetical protein
MPIELSNYRIESGAYGIIIIDQLDNRVLKLFKSYNHPALNGTGKEEWGEEATNDYRSRVYQSEKEAYELVQNSELLRRFTPEYFGEQEVDRVLDNGIDVTNQYLTNCCFKLSFINGKSCDLIEYRENETLAERAQRKYDFDFEILFQEFSRNQINYLEDAAVITNTDYFKIIDFGTKDPFSFQPILEPRGIGPYDGLNL